MKYDIVLWDFDGTMVDTSEGIFASVRYAFGQLGLAEPPPEILRKFIGPPIAWAFREAVGLDEEQTARGVALFRQDYRERGILISEIYAGVDTLIEKLRERGVKNAVATLKPEVMASRLLHQFGIAGLLDACCGTQEDLNVSADKSDIIHRALRESGCAAGTRAVLVGDTRHDAAGAEKAGVAFIAAGYGYGFLHAGEPIPPGAAAAQSVEQLEELLLTE